MEDIEKYKGTNLGNLADYVYMIIVPSEYKDQILKIMPENLADKAFYLSHENLDVWQLSEKYILLCMG